MFKPLKKEAHETIEEIKEANGTKEHRYCPMNIKNGKEQMGKKKNKNIIN